MASIPTSRRTLAMQLDGTCTKLDECPECPEGTVRSPLTGGSIAIAGLQRWRYDGAGDLIEYAEWKLPVERQVGKSPYKNVWWKE